MRNIGNHQHLGAITAPCAQNAHAGGAHTNRANPQPAPGKHPDSRGGRCETTRTTDTGVPAPAVGVGTQDGKQPVGGLGSNGMQAAAPLTSTELAAVPQGSDAFLVLEQAVAAHRLAKARP